MSASGMKPKAPKDTSKPQDPPQRSPAHSGACKTPSFLGGRTTSAGSVAPLSEDHRVEEDFTSPPDFEDPGTSNMVAGSEQAGRSEPLVPPVLEKTSKAQLLPPPRLLLLHQQNRPLWPRARLHRHRHLQASLLLALLARSSPGRSPTLLRSSSLAHSKLQRLSLPAHKASHFMLGEPRSLLVRRFRPKRAGSSS
jgi:hypothetical protein